MTERIHVQKTSDEKGRHFATVLAGQPSQPPNLKENCVQGSDKTIYCLKDEGKGKVHIESSYGTATHSFHTGKYTKLAISGDTVYVKTTFGITDWTYQAEMSEAPLEPVNTDEDNAWKDIKGITIPFDEDEFGRDGCYGTDMFLQDTPYTMTAKPDGLYLEIDDVSHIVRPDILLRRYAGDEHTYPGYKWEIKPVLECALSDTDDPVRKMQIRSALHMLNGAAEITNEDLPMIFIF